MKWESFFGPENIQALRWSTLVLPGNAARTELQPFMELVERKAPIAALPRMLLKNGGVQWYVGWRSESDARFAQELLRAFLGRTYAAMREPVCLLEPRDAAEHAFSDEFEGRAFRVDVGELWRRDARTQLGRLAQLLLRRPVRLARSVRPVGRVLRDLEFALESADHATVAAEIDLLRVGGHLDEVNLAFLELRRLGAQQDWDHVLRHESLESLLAFRNLPWRVRGVLLSAVYHHHLAALVAQGDVAAARKRVEDLLPVFEAAFATRRNLSGLEASVCFLLADDVREAPVAAFVDDALREIEEHGYASFAAAYRLEYRCTDVAAQPPFTEVPPSIEAAQQALADGDLDRAYSIASICSASTERARTLLLCARFLDDEDASVLAVAACDELPPPHKSRLFAFEWCASHYEQLKIQLGSPSPIESQAGPTAVPAPLLAPPVSWRAWFERLHAKTSWPGAVSRVVAGANAWSVEELAADPDALAITVATLGASLEPWATDALRQAMPSLVHSFLHEPGDPRLAPVVTSLFELLATDDVLSLPSVSALVRIAHFRLLTSVGGYAETVGTVVGAVEQVSSPRTVRLVAEALEMLLMVPCLSLADRGSAVTRLATVANRWWSRMDALDRFFVRRLCGELDLGELLPDANCGAEVEGEGTDWHAALRGRVVAIYSLTESALKRAADILQGACPSVRVKTFHEHVATASMREAARTADLFVISTRSATHAATNAIMQDRRGPTEYAAGKGSASLLEAVRQWVGKTTVGSVG